MGKQQCSRDEWNKAEGRRTRLEHVHEHRLVHLTDIPGFERVIMPKKGIRQRCRFCYQRISGGCKDRMPKFSGSKTPYGCKKCRVPLCKKERFGESQSCFQKW